MESELFDICSERNSAPADQRKRLLRVLKAGADVHEADKNGVTALHHAVRFRNPAAVKTLIEYGADVNRACRRTAQPRSIAPPLRPAPRALPEKAKPPAKLSSCSSPPGPIRPM
jgi:ankyrin repeat protein